jgi:hypothetical protein
MAQYETSWWRALLGLIAGAVVGTLLLTANQADTFAQGLAVAPVLFAAVGAVMLLLGVPFWVSLHWSGDRDWSDAMLLGGAMGFACTAAVTGHARRYLGSIGAYYLAHGRVVLLGGHMSQAALTLWLMQAALAGVIGSVAGLVVWRIAYRDARS